MKKLLFTLVLTLIALTANAQVYSFDMENEQKQNVKYRLVIDTNNQQIKVLENSSTTISFKYRKLLKFVKRDDNSSNYEKLNSLTFFFYSADVVAPKDIPSSIDDIIAGKYGDCCILSFAGAMIIQPDGLGLTSDHFLLTGNESYVIDFLEFVSQIASTSSHTNIVDLNKANATTLKAEAEKGNPEAIYLLGCRYHDGQLAGIDKNDRLSYQWMLTYNKISDDEDSKKALEYIKNNLQRSNNTFKPSDKYLNKETNLTPIDLILHPLAYFPTSAIFMKKEKVEKKIVSKKRMKLYRSNHKEYDNEHIQIRARDNDMPQLYGKNIDKMEFGWSSKYPTHHRYEYTFNFADRKEAETFLYTIAYETMQEGVFWKRGVTPRKIDEDTALDWTSNIIIKKKKCFCMMDLYLWGGDTVNTFKIVITLIENDQ